MSSCSVAICCNTYKKCKEKNIIFHRFPQKNLDLTKEWTHRCRRKDAVNPRNARICSEHFMEDDYEDDMKNRLLGLPQKRKLKELAVPNVNLPALNTDDQISARSERQKRRKILQNAHNRIKTLSPSKTNANSLSIDNHQHATENNCEKCNILEKEIENLKLKLFTANNVIQVLRSEKRCIVKKTSRKLKRDDQSKNIRAAQIYKLKTKIHYLTKENASLRNSTKCMRNVFSETQIDALMNKKNIKWTSEDVSQAIVARALSSRAYDFWREKMSMPLPSASTIKRWCAKFTCSPGILEDVLLLMKKNSENLSPREKMCVLSFDEMHIDSKLCYDTKLDEILGPFKKVQFVLIRGLFSSWKQPVYFDFDKQMTLNLLLHIIKNIESTGLQVKAIVSDLGGSQTLWKDLKISEGNSYFFSPSHESSKIWVFADMPHYIKLLRNHFLDKGMVLSDGTIINSSIIKEVLEKDVGEIKRCYKLKPSILNVKGNDRQKVLPAKTLFSETTAKAIAYLTGNVRASNFFLIIDKFFDIMNSKCPEPPSNKPLKAGFGIKKYFNDQLNVLNYIKKEISELRVVGKKSMLPFQKAIIISINSLLGLHEDLRSDDVEYILTTRLTQDVLESLFSQIRGLGRFNDHPSPSEVIMRLKRLLLANKLPNLSPKVNQNDVNNKETYLTSEMLQHAFDPNVNPEILHDQQNEVINCEDVLEESASFEWERTLTEKEKISENEEEALAFIAGFIAYRLRLKYNDSSLGTITKDLTIIPPYANWIVYLSAGGLTTPTPSWMETIRKMDIVFRQFHGENFRSGRGIINLLISELEARFPTIQKSAIRLFSRIRTFIRIRHLNRTASLISYRKAQQKNKKWIASKL